MRLVTNVHIADLTGGVELNVFQISRELARRGHQVDLLYRQPGALVPEYQKFCHSVTKVPEVDYWFPDGRRGRPRQMARMVPAVGAAMLHRPQIIYGNRFTSTGWAIPAGKGARAPVVCHDHGINGGLSARRIDRLNRHVDRFVVVSQWLADVWIGLGIDPAIIDVVFNGIDPAEYPNGGAADRTQARRALDLPDEHFVVTFVGRLDREKGVDVLLRAWRQLGLGPGEATLLVVGSSTAEHDADRYRSELGELATASVRFLPGRRDVVTPLNASDVAVVPSVVQESFGRTVIEAMSTGRPVLASRVGGVPEILTGPLARLLFEPGNADQLAQKLDELRGWHDDEPELGPLCRKRLLDTFTLEQTVDGVEAAFATAIAGT